MVHILTETWSCLPPPLPINISFVIRQHPCGSNCNCLHGKVVLGGFGGVFVVAWFGGVLSVCVCGVCFFNSFWCVMVAEKNLNISFCCSFKMLLCQLCFCGPRAVSIHWLLPCGLFSCLLLLPPSLVPTAVASEDLLDLISLVTLFVRMALVFLHYFSSGNNSWYRKISSLYFHCSPSFFCKGLGCFAWVSDCLTEKSGNKKDE